MPTRIALASLLSVFATAVHAHHSFAMYDRDEAIVFTGVVTSIEPDMNHLMIQFAPMNESRDGVLRDDAGEPVIWALELQAASAVARYGITKTGFAVGTVFSGAMHPARSGAHSGTQVMDTRNARVLFKCPNRTPPEPGRHCDSVADATSHGTAEVLPESTGSLGGR